MLVRARVEPAGRVILASANWPQHVSNPGLEGVVPFRFSCHRCGHCCSGGAGYVWLEEGEAERMAQRLGVSLAAFEQEHVRVVPHPETGALRQSLREDSSWDSGGRCRLLRGVNECSVYEDRPQHCRQFPFWDSVLENKESFGRARDVCPGITEEPLPESRERAFEELAKLYREVDALVEKASPVCIMRGVCCRFEEAEHQLYATTLETDYAAHCHPEAPAPEAPGRCAYHVAGKCTAREGRPLGCRTYFCDSRTQSVLEEGHEHFLRRIREIGAEHNYPVAYANFPASLLERIKVGDSPNEEAPGAR